MDSQGQIYVMKEPLIAFSNEPFRSIGVLPAGTTLHYEQTFPEGFDRYRVFVNIEGSQFPLHDVPREDLVDPLTSFAAEEAQAIISIERLKELLTSLGVTKADLEALLANY